MLIANYKLIFVLIRIISLIAEHSTKTSSFIDSDNVWRNFRTPRSKFYYYFTPRSLDAGLAAESATSRGDYGHYQGYQAHWPSALQQPIHVHHTIPYSKEKSDHFGYLLPLLLLGLLPLLFGALLLLPLLFMFFTNILQLLAMMQQTMQTTTTPGTNVGRKRRNIEGVNPYLTSTVISLVENLSSALEKYNDKSKNF